MKNNSVITIRNPRIQITIIKVINFNKYAKFYYLKTEVVTFSVIFYHYKLLLKFNRLIINTRHYTPHNANAFKALAYYRLLKVVRFTQLNRFYEFYAAFMYNKNDTIIKKTLYLTHLIFSENI